jgi:hypothetical protein
MSDDYNRLSGRQTALWLAAEGPFHTAVASLAVAPGATAAVCDFGCSTGRNSVAPLRAAVAHCAAHGAREVALVDLPGTDWRATFATVTPEALVPDPSPGSLPADRILLYGAPRSFYGPVLPPGSVDFAYSLTATHWLSRAPAPITGGGIHPLQETEPLLVRRRPHPAPRSPETAPPPPRFPRRH